MRNLKRFGVKSDIILLPEEKHAFILFDYYAPHDTVVKIMDKIADKINEYLKEVIYAGLDNPLYGKNSSGCCAEMMFFEDISNIIPVAEKAVLNR